jgi:hypothetical protein
VLTRLTASWLRLKILPPIHFKQRRRMLHANAISDLQYWRQVPFHAKKESMHDQSSKNQQRAFSCDCPVQTLLTQQKKSQKLELSPFPPFSKSRSRH